MADDARPVDFNGADFGRIEQSQYFDTGTPDSSAASSLRQGVAGGAAAQQSSAPATRDDTPLRDGRVRTPVEQLPASRSALQRNDRTGTPTEQRRGRSPRLRGRDGEPRTPQVSFNTPTGRNPGETRTSSATHQRRVNSNPPAPTKQTSDAQTDTMETDIVFHSQYIEFAPVFLMLWTPILLMVNGISYTAFWRVEFLEQLGPTGEPSPAMTFFVVWLMFSLVFVHGLLIPRAFRAAVSSLTRKERKESIYMCLLLHAFFVLPLAGSELSMMMADPREIWLKAAWPFAMLPLVSSMLNCISGTFVLWFIYVTTFVQYLHRRVRNVADAYLSGNHAKAAHRCATEVPSSVRFNSATPFKSALDREI